MPDTSEPVPAVPVLPVRGLAYLGDAVYELWIRELAMAQLKAGVLASAEDLHRFGIHRAKAEYQVQLLHHLSDHLTEAEKEVVRRGRNAAVSVGRRANQSRHRQATGFEALIGHLHLVDPVRLHHLFQQLQPYLLSLDEP